MQPVRIEPQLLSVPNFYGSAGEPFLGSIPKMGRDGPFAPPTLGSPLGMLLSLGMMGLAGGANEAQTPQAVPDNMDYIRDQLRRRLAQMENAPPADVMPDEMSFGDAFAAARKGGLKEFSWRKKRFHTRLKRE